MPSTSPTIRHQPKLPYCGLTIIMSNPSRFDTRELLSGVAGAWFFDKLRNFTKGKVLRFHCDIRTSNCTDPLLGGTRVVFCLGEVAQHEWFNPSNSLKEQRGSPHVSANGTVFLSSFTPQDAHDFQPYEQRLNSNFRGTADDDEESDDDEAKSHKGATRRGNFRFWLEQDIRKCARILLEGTQRSVPPVVRLYPPAADVISVLQSTKNSTLYLDIETLLNRTLTCVGFSFEGCETLVVPFRRFDYRPSYTISELSKICRAIGTAMRDNLCVTHNGHGFDWLVLAHHYRIPFGRRLYDTMISMNRLWPEAEKSLGHCLSLLTDEPYHKDEGVFDPRTAEQELQLWQYNAKDVHAMKLLKAAFDKECAADAGLAASIEQGQRMIYPYLVAALRGMRADEKRLSELVTENDRYLMQLLRIAKILVGQAGYATLQGKSEAGLLSSNKQAAKYFYQWLGYKCPRKTDTGEDAVDTKAMLKLSIALSKQGIHNPMIALRLKYAEVKKETSMLANLNLWNEKAYV
jgi:hypothetical protein